MRRAARLVEFGDVGVRGRAPAGVSGVEGQVAVPALEFADSLFEPVSVGLT